MLFWTQSHLAPTIPSTQPSFSLPTPSRLEAHHAQPNTDALQPCQQMPTKGLGIISTSPRRFHKLSMAPAKAGAAGPLPGTHRTRSCFSPAKSFLLIRVMLLPLSSLQREEAEVSGEALRRRPGTGAPQWLPKKGRQDPKDSSSRCVSVLPAGNSRAGRQLPERTLILNGQQCWAHRSLAGQECVSWHLSKSSNGQGLPSSPQLHVPTLDAPLGTEAPEPSAMQ